MRNSLEDRITGFKNQSKSLKKEYKKNKVKIQHTFKEDDNAGLMELNSFDDHLTQALLK